MWNKIAGTLFGKVLDKAEGIIDEVVTTDEERAQKKIELRQLFFEFEKEVFKLEVEDRKSARDMYSNDAIIQKILASLFTIAYFGLTYIMFRYFVQSSINLSDYEIGFISTVFGAMSAKVNTIIDFFFGGSSKRNSETNN